MPEIKIKVRDKCAEGKGVVICNNSDYTVVWDLDGEWTPYGTKTMRVNLADGTYQDVVFTGDNATLPVLTASGWVSVGLYAGDIHTSRAARLLALSSVLTPGGSPAVPAEDVYAQIMAKLNELSTVSPEDIAKAVADYLAAHPIEETDPTVQEWAKAKTKPTYSAAEVGAIAQSDLQAATDAALAQAKASGEFDGPQGPAGAPGKDGAGMDITGATVGQIAKITAVDASGVPTAWAAADMPSGGSGRVFGTYDYTALASGTIPAGTVTALGLGTSYFDTGVTVGDLRGYRVWACYYRCDAGAQYYGFALASDITHRRLIYSMANAQQIVAIWADDDGQAVIPIGGISNVYCTDPLDAANIGGLVVRPMISNGGGTVIASFGAFSGAADSDHIYAGIFHLNSQESNAKDMRWAITGVVKK